MFTDEKKRRPDALAEIPGAPEADGGELAEIEGADAAPEYADLFKKKSYNKKHIFMAAGVLVLAAVGVGVWLLVSGGGQGGDSGGTLYREYTVARGGITVGNSESSSISLDRETVTFPVSASVEEVYVKAGSSVKEGDPLVKLNLEDIEAGLASYEIQLQNAALELEKAKLEEQTKLLKAEQDYETSVQTGELAGDSETLSLMQLENSLVSAQTKYDSAEEALAELEEIRDDFDIVYSRLEKYEDEMDDAEDALDTLQRKLERMRTKEEIEADGTISDSAKAQELDAREALEDKIKDAQEDYDDAQQDYKDALEEYNEDYSLYEDEEALYDKITEAKNSLASASAALLQAELNYQSGTLSAEQKTASSELDSSVAATEYQLTASELSQAIDEKQEAYDEMLSEIEEIKASVNDDGVIYSPCTGMVASVSVEVGDSFEVYYDENTGITMTQTILTLTDIGDVYVPITISEEDILNVYIGQEAAVTMTAFEGRTFAAEVDTIAVESSRSGAATVSYTVNVRFSETNELEMYEGMSAEITLIQKQVQDVLYINSAAVSFDSGVSTVYLKGGDGEPVLTEVTTGFSDGQYVEITSGLSEGDVVMAASSVSARG